MPLDKDNPTLGPEFVRAAQSGISARTVASWDPELPRDASLLVPVELRALVVPPGTSLECARTGLRAGEDPAEGFPEAFDEEIQRPAGIYLHWLLPDGLTQGNVAEGGQLDLPPLPNRWVILRVEPGQPRAVQAFIVESELAQSGRLDVEWHETDHTGEGGPSGLRPDQLTATVGGDAAGAVAFDSAENRFGWYDDLAGVESSSNRLAYVVVGWYSVETLDVLHREPGAPPFEEVMRRLGWQVDRAQLADARAAAEGRRAAAETAHALPSPPLSVAGPETRLTLGETEIDVPATVLPERALGNAAGVSVKVEPWAPSRSIYHGVLYGVDPSVSAASDPRPDPSAIAVSVGATGAEGLARAIAAGAEDQDRAEIERLLTAFSYGRLDAFESADGLATLDEELHLRAFVGSPGGTRMEQIRTGDPLPEPPPDEDRKRELEERERERREQGPELRFSEQRYTETADEFAEKTRGETLEPQPDPVKVEAVPRAEPRYFHPQDPVVAVHGAKRSLGAGFDGRFSADERLACRLSGQTISRYAGLVAGVDLVEPRFEHGGIPPEVEKLLYEALLEDPFAVEEMTSAASALSGIDEKAVGSRMQAERQLTLRGQLADSDAPRLVAASLREGTEGSPVAFNIWGQAWHPLYLEWELELRIDEDLAPERWRLGELDWEPAQDLEPQRTRTLKGRSVLTAAPAMSFADAVNSFLAQEDVLDAAGQGGEINETTEALLRSAATGSAFADVLSAGLDGIRLQLLGFEKSQSDFVDPDEGEPPPPVPTGDPTLLRAGYIRLTRLRVADSFGRTVELPAEALEGVLASESLEPSTAADWPAGSLYLAPRLMPPSRLLMRLLDAEDDANEATLDQGTDGISPIAGFALPDNVDSALELFDAGGTPLGQLRHESLGGGVSWEGAPGSPSPLGSAPSESITNRHVAEVATALVERDVAERSTSEERSETPLSALLRVIDTTRWTVDPFGQTGTEHLSVLVGRPIAIVRAALRLEVQPAPEEPYFTEDQRALRQQAYAELSQSTIDVRLGALTLFRDGLLGYFVDDDYRRFHPVHSSVLQEARPSGPRTGYLGPHDEKVSLEEPEPIRSAYVQADPTVSVRPGQTVALTLLMDPGSSVHVTSGVLPRKSIALVRDWIDRPLEQISPSFRIGPVLLDPITAALPKASGLPTEQLWSYRDTPASWRDRQIVASSQQADLPEESPVAQEGYVRVRPAEGSGKAASA
jgi:hypothetical protein